MKKYLPLIIVLLILSAISCYMYSQVEPVFEQDIDYISNAKIVLDAPIEGKIGELIILDASASEAESFIWRVIPDTSNFQIIEDGKRAFFTSSKPGLYLFVVAAAKSGDVDCVVHEIQILGDPTVEDEFTLLVKSWLPKKLDRQLLQALSRSFTASCEAEDVPTLVKQTSVANQAVLGKNLEAYKPFLVKFSEYLKENYQNATLEEHKVLWLKIAETLKSC